MRWKIFYDNGSTFTDVDGKPFDAPKRGVIAITVQDGEHGRALCRDNDFYIWNVYDGNELWQGVDWFGLWDYLVDPGVKIVLFGRTIGNKEYRNLINKVVNDPYLPNKTGWAQGERR